MKANAYYRDPIGSERRADLFCKVRGFSQTDKLGPRPDKVRVGVVALTFKSAHAGLKVGATSCGFAASRATPASLL